MDEVTWFVPFEEDLKHDRIVMRHGDDERVYVPERKTGKWEYVQYDGNPKIGNWHCSECRLIVNLGFEGEPYYHYCPNCGAKMRG